ncbi:uncharacterized protein C8Q71DRAFT_776718 [Rhodofomes roseus]|uniref:Myosin-binding domain-containing protein n=1 Tax=Rhodofomes roseus TaxID=34475 RepID=A0ABQ8K6J2_9APHY|nr:uncharacterized protein C8Q71DRAFT_776718 [Rhodofomes roseus]KAH9832502.1 hypothetical protein C8Q71DRAFT_776718 [Rhodofomes roseus]
MAEAVFDDHPLEEYFRLTGEGAQPIPGGVSEFTQDLDESNGEPQEPLLALERLPPTLVNLIQIAASFFEYRQSSEHAFAERFKYDVISSSLLSTTISATPTVRRTFTLEVPDKLNDASDIASSDGDKSGTVDPSPLSELQVPIAMVCFAAVALAAEYYFVAIFLMLASTYSWHSVKANSEEVKTTAATLDAVNQLIRAGNVWDSSVNEAISIVEKEERSIFYGPSSPRSPSSSLRVTLQSSLHTTQNQCDNVRQLLSALTDHSQLSQISEMYAPSSPPKPAFSMLDHPRPLSVPMGPLARQRTISTPTNKRSTWNGSYAALAQAGSPLAHFQKRRSRRSADLTALFEPPPSKFSMSAPASPQRFDPVQEEREEDDDDTDSDAALGQGEYFGAAALDLQRKRTSAGMEVFGVPPPSYASSARHARRISMGQQPTIPSSSRLTTVHTTRHPLSLTGLQFALHGALSAKRYACSHLLALRFGEEEDDTYWEDVRSVMALLTSTFEDASARLTEALDIAEKNRVKDERPSPRTSVDLSAGNRPRPVRTMAEMVSFAPMPSHLARFAAHVDAMSTALNDARENLEQCVASLRDTTPGEAGPCDGEDSATSIQEHPAFQAYDKLRKELGYALRECERGRERLLDIISGPRQMSGEDPDSPDDTPGLRNDNGSDTSEKPGPSSPALHAPAILSLSDAQGALGLSVDPERPDEELDDATAHLLMTASSRHLPPPGVEQVYEAETGGAPSFTRERSKLSREERVKLAKARRDSGQYGLASLSEMPLRPQAERWGPGGEVVQELKDVIWKVGERRRQLTGQLPVGPEQAPLVAVDDTPQTESTLETFDIMASIPGTV